jgi:hypothetical protein
LALKLAAEPAGETQADLQVGGAVTEAMGVLDSGGSEVGGFIPSVRAEGGLSFAAEAGMT